MPAEQVMHRESYCTSCKQDVSIADAMYIRLANRRAIIRGKCSKCGSELIKASIMPRSSAIISRKRSRGRIALLII
jgi:predicted RNA-binding Zn-ribbon protein involved in translation (DUF1610 family)